MSEIKLNELDLYTSMWINFKSDTELKSYKHTVRIHLTLNIFKYFLNTNITLFFKILTVVTFKKNAVPCGFLCSRKGIIVGIMGASKVISS